MEGIDTHRNPQDHNAWHFGRPSPQTLPSLTPSSNKEEELLFSEQNTLNSLSGHYNGVEEEDSNQLGEGGNVSTVSSQQASVWPSKPLSRVTRAGSERDSV